MWITVVTNVHVIYINVHVTVLRTMHFLLIFGNFFPLSIHNVENLGGIAIRIFLFIEKFMPVFNKEIEIQFVG